MKYLFNAALFAACALTLAACGEKKTQEVPPAAPVAPAPVAPAPVAPAPAPAAPAPAAAQ